VWAHARHAANRAPLGELGALPVLLPAAVLTAGDVAAQTDKQHKLPTSGARPPSIVKLEFVTAAVWCLLGDAANVSMLRSMGEPPVDNNSPASPSPSKPPTRGGTASNVRRSALRTPGTPTRCSGPPSPTRRFVMTPKKGTALVPISPLLVFLLLDGIVSSRLRTSAENMGLRIV
jgi:hypothetical protein